MAVKEFTVTLPCGLVMELDFFDELTQKIRSRTVITGPSTSGKSFSITRIQNAYSNKSIPIWSDSARYKQIRERPKGHIIRNMDVPETFAEALGKYDLGQHLTTSEEMIVLYLIEIDRKIEKGSIILLDDYDVHLSCVWQRVLIRHISDLAQRFDCQLICSTKSKEVDSCFYHHEQIDLLKYHIGNE